MIVENKLEKLIALVTLLLAALASHASAAQVRLEAGLATPVLLAEKKQNAYIKVALTGIPFGTAEKRAPVNIAIVLDRSGSMSGEKLEEAKRAAILALDSLSSEDIVSIVVYEDSVEVLVPATKVSEKETIKSRIRDIKAGGSTALFAGVSKGAQELRKFLNKERVNRIILLSDGIANVGPSSPGELAELGTSLAREGLSVSTVGLGLGYNEDLMSRLASNGAGSHYFAEKAQDLASIYDRELGRTLSVVAQQAVVTIECSSGVRPIRVLNRDAEIGGNRVTVQLDHIYAESEKYLVLEVEVPAGTVGVDLPVADVKVTCTNLATKAPEESRKFIVARFTKAQAEVDARTDRGAMESAVEQIATEKHQLAITLRDQGKIAEAQKVLYLNGDFLTQNSTKLQSEKLQKFSEENRTDAQNLDDKNWNRQRKSMSAGDVWRVKQ